MRLLDRLRPRDTSRAPKPQIRLHTLAGPELVDCGACGGRAIGWTVCAEACDRVVSAPTRLAACGCGWKEAR